MTKLGSPIEACAMSDDIQGAIFTLLCDLLRLCCARPLCVHSYSCIWVQCQHTLILIFNIIKIYM